MTSVRSASRRLAVGCLVTVLAPALAACGDSSGPEDFDPAGVAAEFAAVDEAFDAPAIGSFGVLIDKIEDVLEPPRPATVRASAARIPEIPEEFLGETFAWDVDANEYVQSGENGAPPNGVRFVLYTVSGGAPVEPLVELGHADVVVLEESPSSGRVRVTVVNDDDETELDYTIEVSETETKSEFVREGFANEGDGRVTFRSTLSVNGASRTGTITQLIEMPGRDLRFEAEFIRTTDGNEKHVERSLDLATDRGDITIDGEVLDDDGTLDVKYFGDLVARITIAPDVEPTVTGTNGHTVTDEERDLTLALFHRFDGGFDFYFIARDPTGMTD